MLNDKASSGSVAQVTGVNFESLIQLLKQSFLLVSATKNKAFKCALLQTMAFVQGLVADDIARQGKSEIQGQNDVSLAEVLSEIMFYAMSKGALIQQAVLSLSLSCLNKLEQGKGLITYSHHCYLELWAVDLLHRVLTETGLQLVEKEIKTSLVELARLNGRSIIWHCNFSGVKQADLLESKYFLLGLLRGHCDNYYDLPLAMKKSPLVRSYCLKYNSPFIINIASKVNEPAANQASSLALPDLSSFAPHSVNYKKWQVSLLELSVFLVDTGVMLYKIADNKRSSLPALVRCKKAGISNRATDQDTISETTITNWLGGKAARKDSLLRLSCNLINELDLVKSSFDGFFDSGDIKVLLTDTHIVSRFIVALAHFIKDNLRTTLRLFEQDFASKSMTRFSPETLLCEKHAHFSWLAEFMFADRDLL